MKPHSSVVHAYPFLGCHLLERSVFKFDATEYRGVGGPQRQQRIERAAAPAFLAGQGCRLRIERGQILQSAMVRFAAAPIVDCGIREHSMEPRHYALLVTHRFDPLDGLEEGDLQNIPGGIAAVEYSCRCGEKAVTF